MRPSLRQQIDAIADVRWWHPAWRSLIWGTSCLAVTGGAPSARRQQLYRRANGGPASDTFMARDAGNRYHGSDIAAVAARAVVGAAAAIERLDWLQTRQPGQTLQAVVRWSDGWLEPHRLTSDEARTAFFVAPRGIYRAKVEPASLLAVASCLASDLASEAALLAGILESVDTQAAGAARAAVVVSLLPQRIPDARHLHRSAWSRGGGPWLGVGFAADLDVVSTCHLGVDGFGHALLTDGICARIADQAPALTQRLRAADDRWSAPRGDTACESAEPDLLGFAARDLPDGAGRFAHQAYAMGRALGRFLNTDRVGDGAPPARFSPTFQVPVAPASSDGGFLRDADVFHGLLSVRKSEAGFEPLSAFEARLPDWIERERHGEGVLSRIGLAIAGSPLPRAAKLRLLRSRREPSPWLPPVEVLCGRGRLSSLRFPRSYLQMLWIGGFVQAASSLAIR